MTGSGPSRRAPRFAGVYGWAVPLILGVLTLVLLVIISAILASAFGS